MKFCKWCQTEKPLDQFHFAKKMADGHLNKCKSCCYEWQKQYRLTDAGKAVRKKEKQYPKNKIRYKKSEKGKLAAARYKRPKDREAAKNAVRYALRTGKLIRKPCEVCGSKLSEAHHPSYEREHRLIVKWLCRHHHNEEHRKLDEKTSWNSMNY